MTPTKTRRRRSRRSARRTGGTGRRKYRGLWLREDPRWLVLESKPVRCADPLAGELGRPGLWRFARAAEGGRAARVFELPRRVLSSAPDDEDSPSPEAACLAWAAATCQGQAPADWQAPPHEEVNAWLGPEGLAVRSGGILAQGELICGEGHLAVRVPVLHRIREGVSPSRHAHLRALLVDGLSAVRLVRLEMDAAAAPAVVAEVDLTGAPRSVLEGLFRVSVAGLRWVARWLMEPADFIVDASRPCRALEVRPARLYAAERR